MILSPNFFSLLTHFARISKCTYAKTLINSCNVKGFQFNLRTIMLLFHPLRLKLEITL